VEQATVPQLATPIEAGPVHELSLVPRPDPPEPGIRLTHVTDDDQPFLVALLLDARAAELAALALDDADTRLLVDLQLGAQRSRLRATHPAAEDHVVWSGSTRVGRCCVERGARQHRLLDLTVLTRARRRRIATQVVEHLQAGARAHGVPLRTSVPAADQAARGLLVGSGFGPCQEVDGRIELVWQGPDRVVTLPH
jgi:GNAT superfamily N-acetyltransferase